MLIFSIILAYYQISNNVESSQLVSSIFPVAYAVNTNLFVSAENSQFDNYMSGPQVIEVVVIDSNISDTNQAKGEPDVTVNGQILRMVQAIDGNWYGYFADRNMVIIADATSSSSDLPLTVDTTPKIGLDFGTFCESTDDIAGLGPTAFTDTVGVAVPNNAEGLSGAAVIAAGGIISGTACAGTFGANDANNVVREAKTPSQFGVVIGQIGLATVNDFPFIQLYNLNPTGNVVIQYNKGGGVQTTTLTFDTVSKFAKASLDKAVYTQGSEVHLTITNSWLNIDPTDEDSWTFGTVGTFSTNYQIFDENGVAVGDSPTNTASGQGTLTNQIQLHSLMCADNCVLRLNPNVQGTGNVVTLQDNADSVIVATTGGTNPQNPADWQTAGLNLAGSVPITITEQGPNSGIFGSYDESDTSNIVITNAAMRGTSASLDYNDASPVTILVGFNFATINLNPIDAEWNSGEKILISLVDGDANKNSRVDEDLDLFDPNVALIPSLRTGSPNTLADLTAVTLDSVPATFTVQKFSDRALFSSDNPTTISAGDELVLTFGTMANIFSSTPINKANFHGFILLNYDVRALKNTLGSGITTVDITLAGVTSNVVSPSPANTFDNAPLNGLILLNTDSFKGLSPNVSLVAKFAINGAGGTIPSDTVLPVVVDIFGYGFTNDGRENNERFANQIIRLELKEIGDNTGIFHGSLEYIMINQLNILNSATYTGLTTISDEPSFIVIENLIDEDSPRVTYNDLGADGTVVQVSDQEAVPTHHGKAFFDKQNLSAGDTAIITLEDLDLNVDTDLIDIYTVVTIPADANFDVVGDETTANGGASIELDNGDQLGRLLDVTFDDVQWKTPIATSACLAPLVTLVGTDTGFGGTGFSLIETTGASGIFTGDFQVPVAWCRPGVTAPESVTGLDIEVNYVDFRDESGKFTEVDPPDKYELKLDSGSFTYPRGFQISKIISSKFGTTENFFFLQVDHYLDSAEKNNLKAKGITLIDSLNGFVYVAKATDQSLGNFSEDQYPEIRSMIPIEAQTKIDSKVKSKNIPPWAHHNKTSVEDDAVFTIFFHEKIPANDMNQIITFFDGTPGKTMESLGSIRALIPFDQIENLAEHSAVKFIIFPDPPLESEISEVRIAAQIDQIKESYELSGRGSVALIFEEALVTQIEEFNNLIPIGDGPNNPEYSQEKHANQVAGILGADNVDNTKDGIAPETTILSFGTSHSVLGNLDSNVSIWHDNAGDLEEAWILANPPNSTFHIDVMNISLGHKVKGEPCEMLGDYSSTSKVLDELVKGLESVSSNLPSVIITKSAGNNRNIPNQCTLEQGEVYPSNFSTINSPATAKNPIVVGAIYSRINSSTDQVIYEHSGFGPTDDGRIKPDLVAYGAHTFYEGIFTTGLPGSTVYSEASGTSMSAALVGGIVALMEEEWKDRTDKFNPNLFPHTAKGILIHTADDLGKPGPDYKYGWGKVNPKHAIDLINNSSLFDGRNGEPVSWKEFTIIYDSVSNHIDKKEYKLHLEDTTDLKVSLVWDDLPSNYTDDSRPSLVNDLDLRVILSDKPPIKPKSMIKNMPNDEAVERNDTINNVEMIKESLRGNQDLTIQVTLKPGLHDSEGQDFTLIVSKTKSEIQLPPLDTTSPITTALPGGGTYPSAKSVTLTANEAATIYYTTNGFIPTTSSSVYTTAIPISSNTTLKFFAKDTAKNIEAVKTQTYTINTTTIPSITINDVSLTEGNSGTKNFEFTVARSTNTSTVSINYFTTDNTAVIPVDYTAKPTASPIFTAGGPLTQTVSVPVLGDIAVEPNETFFVNLSNCIGCTITDSQGVGTITNDDSAPTPNITINDITLTEGDSGTKNFEFTVTRSSNSGPISIKYSTADNTAISPTDYLTILTTTLNFVPGDPLTKKISVFVNGDGTKESNETFFVNLSNCIGCTITDSQGVGTITNDDSAPATTASVGGGEYTTAQSITLTANKPATIYYTTNGSIPTTSSSVYTTAIPISSNTTLKFFAKDIAGNEEAVQTQMYTINGGGCLIATATYGSEMYPQVQFLREIRDNNLMNTQIGASFMTGFNQFYYTFSPTVADWERENPAFKELVKVGITPMLTSLSILSLANSEQEVLGFGIGVILVNIGMYFALPIFLIVRIKKYFKK